MTEADKWAVFEDRAKSLLVRWGKFARANKKETNIGALSIKGFMAEINDEFTKSLIKESITND